MAFLAPSSIFANQLQQSNISHGHRSRHASNTSPSQSQCSNHSVKASTTGKKNYVRCSSFNDVPSSTFQSTMNECKLQTADSPGSKKAPSDVFIFNVCGTRFEVESHILEHAPTSLLGNPESRNQLYNPKRNEYMIPHDPFLFRYILLFYLTGSLHFPRTECVQIYEQTLEFYGLSQDWIAECCLEDFEDAKSLLDERENQLNFETENYCDTAQYLDDDFINRLRRCSNQQDLAAAGEELLNRSQAMAVAQQNASKKKFHNPFTREKITNLFSKKNLDNFRPMLWRCFEQPQETTLALIIYYVSGFFIAVSVIVNIVETLECNPLSSKGKRLNYGECYETVFNCLDIGCVTLFTIEYLARLFAAPHRWKFFKSYMSLIDVVAILPFYLGLVLPNNKNVSGAFVTLKVFRVFRIFKLSRHSQGLRVLGCTFKACASELGFLLFSISMAIIIFGTIMYYSERSSLHTGFTSIPAAFWYTIVTMTTLGKTLIQLRDASEIATSPSSNATH